MLHTILSLITSIALTSIISVPNNYRLANATVIETTEDSTLLRTPNDETWKVEGIDVNSIDVTILFDTQGTKTIYDDVILEVLPR